MSDWPLLQQYVQTHSEEAFAELVARHIDWVHSCARRLLGDEHLADDVTQAVFLALATHAHRLHQSVALSTWLICVTRNAASLALRNRARRLRHERKAAAMFDESAATLTQDQWAELSAQLDRPSPA